VKSVARILYAIENVIRIHSSDSNITLGTFFDKVSKVDLKGKLEDIFV